MEVYRIDPDRAAYYAPLDVLYIGYGDNSLDSCHAIEDTPSGICVMYDRNGLFAGAEIYDASKTISGTPCVVTIDASVPFRINLPAIPGFVTKNEVVAL